MQLKPVLGPTQLIFYSVGVIVGAGIYSVIGAAAGLGQHHLWLAFVVSAGVALAMSITGRPRPLYVTNGKRYSI
jgi:APA family basic amino acid/polyamine antiporter